MKQTDLQKALEGLGVSFNTPIIEVLDRLVYLSLKDVLEDYAGALEAADEGKTKGYYSWDDVEVEAEELRDDSRCLRRILALYEVPSKDEFPEKPE